MARTHPRGTPRPADDALGVAVRACALHPRTCALRHLTRASRAVVAAFDRALESAHLTGQQFNVLMTLAQMGPMNVKTLATNVGADASTVVRAVRPLARARLLSVAAGTDRRERRLEVTAGGRRRLARALPAWESTQRRVVDALGQAGWKRMTAQLRTISRAVERVTTASTPTAASGR